MQDSNDKYTAFLSAWFKSHDDRFEDILESFKRVWFDEVHKTYSAPADLEKKIGEGEEAFSQLYRLKRLLTISSTPIEDVDWMFRAREEFRQKNYDSALRSFQKAIAGAYPSTDDLILAGTCALYAGRLDYAGSYADQALRLDENEVQALVLRGLVAYRREQFKECYGYLLKAKSIKPEHPAVQKYMPLAEKAISAPFVVSSKESEARLKRRWARRPVCLDLIVNDYEQLSAMSVKVRSLSAGGCLVDPSSVPDQFDFILEFDGSGRVAGTAQKIYSTAKKQVGLKFLNLSPRDEDLINQRLAAL